MRPELSDIVIKNGDVVAVDLETHDPELKKYGSGAIKNEGKVCGIAVAYQNKKFYLPIRHSDTQSNHAPNQAWKVLNKKIFQNKNITKVFHNAMYDVCWIRQESGLMVQGPIVDTMIAASIIDENRLSYSLDSLAKDYLKESKYKYDLKEKASEDLGISDPMSNMHLLPYGLVRDYAEQDVSLTLRLWEIFKKKIDEPIYINNKTKSLRNIFDLEMKLFPCLVDMRFKGVKVNTEKAKTLGKDLGKRKDRIMKGIKKKTGICSRNMGS